MKKLFRLLSKFKAIRNNSVAPIKSVFTNKIISDEKFNIGDYTYGCPTILSWGEGAKLVIGKYCSIAESVTILLGGNHRTDWISTYPFNSIAHFRPEGFSIKGHPVSKGDVNIGHDVWIGMNSFILSGIEIGTGAVIAANSVVTKNVKAYEIVGGNPAKHIRFRFSDKEIRMLLKTEWWNLPEEKVRTLIPYLCSGDIIKLCNRINN